MAAPTWNDIAGLFLDVLRSWKKELRPYDAVPLVVNKSGQIDVFRPLNGWTVINKGTTNVTVNGAIVLGPDEFIAVGGNEGEEYTGFLRVTFVSNTDPGNNVIIYQKFYLTGDGRYDKLTR